MKIDPQQLAEGWEQCELGDVLTIQNGYAFPSKDFDSEGIPLIRQTNLAGDRVSLDRCVYLDPSYLKTHSKFVLKNEDVLIGMSGSIGKLCIYDLEQPALQNQRTGRIVPHSVKDLDSKYLWLFLQTVEKTLGIKGKGLGVSNVSAKDIASLLFVLAPLAEQKRIVAKVEELLARVNAARERLARVPAILKRFRQSILAAACSGRLTADWRDQQIDVQPATKLLDCIRTGRHGLWAKKIRYNGRDPKKAKYPAVTPPNPEFQPDLPDTWTIASMDEITGLITSGSRDWKRFYSTEGPGTFIMAQNVRPLFFDRSYRLAVNPPDDDRDRIRSQVREGDILVTIVGANTGDVCAIPETVDQHYVCQSVALMRPVLMSIWPFLELFLNSIEHGQAQYRKWIYGEGRPHLSFDHLRATAIAIPPLLEQEEILRRVKALFQFADAVEKRTAAARQRVDKMTQAILAKAFAGEIVPTEAKLARHEGREYEPASALLERICKEREREIHKMRNNRE